MIKIFSQIVILLFCTILVSGQNADTIKINTFSSGYGKSSPLKKGNNILKSLVGEILPGKSTSDSTLVGGGFFYLNSLRIKKISKESSSSGDSQLKLKISGGWEKNSIFIHCSISYGTLHFPLHIERKTSQNRFEVLSEEMYEIIDSTATSFIINQKAVTPGIYTYRFFILNRDGQKIYSDELEINAEKGADSFSLTQNFPNPFNSSTKIGFTLPEKMYAKITVFNLLGEKIKILTEDYFDEGFYEIQFDAYNLPSGLYFYILEANSTTSSDAYRLIKRMIYLK